MVRPMGLRSAAGEFASDAGEMASRDAVDDLHHRQNLWIPWTVVLIGLWLITAPYTFGYLNEANWVVPSGGRGVLVLRRHPRSPPSTADDLVERPERGGTGRPRLAHAPPPPADRVVARLPVGVWLVFAPILFWSPTAAGFYNDSIVGLLLIALTILIPGMPAMATYMQMGGSQPPGWTYNPVELVAAVDPDPLGFAGLVVSRYLASYSSSATSTRSGIPSSDSPVAPNRCSTARCRTCGRSPMPASVPSPTASSS